MKNQDHIYLHALHSIGGIGSHKLRLLLAYFDTAQKAWQGTARDYTQAGLPKTLARALIKARKSIDPHTLWKGLQQEGISLLRADDPRFPSLLAAIPQSPYLLYVRGDAQILNQPSVAIVGSRKYSSYGKQAATRLAYDLASCGVHIVSGLALGIDAFAHRGALDARAAGKTIAVLGGSIDDASIAPRAHASLAHKIISAGGTLISEYAPPTTPSRGTFPARNRLMAGMSHATLIIEAARASGTRITADLATEFSRPLFAVPGSIFAQTSVGTNDLIASQQAKIAQDASTIIATLGIKAHPTKHAHYKPETPEEKEIYTLLAQHHDGLSIDKIIRHTTLEGTVVNSTLVLMEMHGVIADNGGGIYIIVSH